MGTTPGVRLFADALVRPETPWHRVPMPYSFRGGFVWGTATAAHQVEGNNVASDFWMLEHAGSLFREPSGDAVDHFHRYPVGHRAGEAARLRAYRFSVEWARIEPRRGFSVAALDHYRRMIASCHEHGVKPCVTFHHFTSPLWFTLDGGWDRANVDRFLRFCERTVKHLGDLIDTAYTINEANLSATLQVAGVFPPGGLKAVAGFVGEAARRHGSSLERIGPFLLGDPMKLRDTMLEAHVRARRDQVGTRLVPGRRDARHAGTTRRCRAARHVRRARAESWDPFPRPARKDDFVGVQTYSRHRYDANGPVGPEAGVPVLIMGYEFWPGALEGTVRREQDRERADPRHRERHRHHRRRAAHRVMSGARSPRS